MLLIGGGSDDFSTMYTVGKRNFYHELLQVAGAHNAYEGALAYPSLSIESLVSIDPDVIIELLPDTAKRKVDPKKRLQLWKKHSYVRAVREKRVVVFTETFAVRPGPRVLDILRLFTGAIACQEQCV